MTWALLNFVDIGGGKTVLGNAGRFSFWRTTTAQNRLRMEFGIVADLVAAQAVERPEAIRQASLRLWTRSILAQAWTFAVSSIPRAFMTAISKTRLDAVLRVSVSA